MITSCWKYFVPSSQLRQRGCVTVCSRAPGLRSLQRGSGLYSSDTGLLLKNTGCCDFLGFFGGRDTFLEPALRARGAVRPSPPPRHHTNPGGAQLNTVISTVLHAVTQDACCEVCNPRLR